MVELADTLNDRTYCPEVRRLGRMLDRWAPAITAWHRSRASNGPVEAINGLAKRVKPDWTKLPTITPTAP